MNYLGAKMKISQIIFIIFVIVLYGCSNQGLKTPGINDIQACENSVDFWVEDELIKSPALDVDQFKKEILSKYCGEEILPNAKILTQNGFKTYLEYTWNEKSYDGVYNPDIRPAVEWIKNNIGDDARITSWWDYGHMIRALGRRDAVLFAPSEEFVRDYKAYYPDWRATFKKEDYLDHNILVDVSRILLAQNPKIAIELLKKYNSKYLLLTSKDFYISNVINRWVGGEYINPSENSLLVSLLKGQDIEGFHLIYSDKYTAIYEIEEFNLTNS